MMATLEHVLDVELSAQEASREWAAFPFHSLVGFFRTPGQRLHWRDDAGSEAWGVVLLVSLGRHHTRIHIAIDYFPVPQALAPPHLDAQIADDLARFKASLDSSAVADEAAGRPATADGEAERASTSG